MTTVLEVQVVNFEGVCTTEPFNARFLILEGSGANPPPKDLTDLDLRMYVRPSTDSGEIVLKLTVDNGRLIIVEDDEEANLEIFIPKNALSVIPEGIYVHDLRDWEGRRIWKGKINFVRGVTR